MIKRWLYHVKPLGPLPEVYAPASLGSEGFIHCSFQPSVAESARLYFAADAALEVLQIDPRRVGVAVEVVDTPRGAMPHVHGPLPASAVTARLTLDEVGRAPDLL